MRIVHNSFFCFFGFAIYGERKNYRDQKGIGTKWQFFL